MSVFYDTSSIPAYIDALYAAIESALPSGDVTLVDGEPPADQATRDRIVIGDVSPDREQEWWTLGNHSRREVFAVSIEITATAPGRTASTARSRAYELLGVIEHVVRGATTLDANGAPDMSLYAENGGRTTVLFTSLLQPSHEMRRFNEGHGCVITTGVRVTADLQLIT